MNDDEAALCLSKLGHTARLSIFRLLIQYGHSGATVGDIQRQTDIAPTTLNHHLEQLQKANWITKQREGREVYCIANFERMNELIGYLMEGCCTN